MNTSGGHDYRGMKVEKEEGRQRGMLPNFLVITGLMVSKLTEPLALTSSQFHYWNQILPKLAEPWQHSLLWPNPLGPASIHV